MNRQALRSISSALSHADALIKKHTHHFAFQHPSIELDFWFLSQRKGILLLWKVAKLGEPYPGGSFSLLDPTIECVHQGTNDTIAVPLLVKTSHSHRSRMTGRKGYYRVRGLRLPRIPLTAHFGLKRGEYKIRLRFGLQDVKGLMCYTPAYDANTTEFEVSLGSIAVKNDLLQSDDQPINELHYAVVDHKKIGRQPLPKLHIDARLPCNVRRMATDDLNPEHYFKKHLLVPARKINQLGYRAFYPTSGESSNNLWSGGRSLQGQRILGEYCGSLALAYRLTGKPEYYYASRIAYEILERNIWRTRWGWAWGIETFREGENLLELGLCAQGVYEFYKITGDKRLLHSVHRILDSWPYNGKHHIPFVEVHQDGKEIHPSYPFNMIAVGCAAIWLISKALNNKRLQRIVKETVHHFLLPMMEPDGHWQYAFHYEEKEKRPEPAGHHYDMLTKRNLARLLEFPEWREDSAFMDAMIRGVEFSLGTCSVEFADEFVWSSHYTDRKGPHFSINHAGLMVSVLALMAKYADRKYMQPLEQTLRYLYEERDRDDLPHGLDWQSGWMHSHVLVPLLNVRESGFCVVGESAHRLQVELQERTCLPT